jgi:hypothetical protein
MKEAEENVKQLEGGSSTAENEAYPSMERQDASPREGEEHWSRLAWAS